MDILENVGNALADGAGEDSDARTEAQLAEDSDAVPSVFFPELRRLGQLLSNADGGPSALYRAMQLLDIGFVLFCVSTGVSSERRAFGRPGMPNQLMRFSNDIMIPLGVACLLLPLESVRVTLRPGGTLEQLNVGEQKVSQAEARRLARVRGFMMVITALIVVINTMQVSDGITATGWAKSGRWQDRVFMCAFGTVQLTSFVSLSSGWMPA